MIWLIDKLFIIFVYVNILSSKLKVFSLPVSKTLFVLCILLYAIHISMNGVSLSKRSILYIFTSFMLILILSSIGLIKGNDLGNITIFIVPIFFLLMLPIMSLLVDEYGYNKYLRHVQYAAVLLAANIILIYVLSECLDLKYYMMVGTQMWENITVSGGGEGLRIFAKTAIYIPAALLITYLRLRRKEGALQFVWGALLCIALYMTKTFGVWLAAVVAVVMVYFIMNRLSLRKMLVGVAGCFVVIMAAMVMYASIQQGEMKYLGGGKDESITTKRQQVSSAMDLFVANPIVGKGLGYKYTAMDWRGTEDVYLEVFYAMLLSFGGIVGTIFYCFIFLYYPFLYLARMKHREELSVVFVACLSIIVASTANPYIWSGGAGFFFPCMLAAMMETHNMRAVGSDHQDVMGCAAIVHID